MKSNQYIFRSPKLSDLPQLLKYINDLVDEDVMIEANYRKVTEEEEKKYLGNLLKDIKAKKAVHLLVFDQNSGKMLGSSGIKQNMFRKQHIGTFGISLVKSARGKGLGKLLMQKVIDMAIKELKINKVILTCFADNLTALKLYTKMGFVKYGHLPKAILYQGNIVDEIQMYKDL